MTKVHRYSFFGKTILIIQSPSIEEAFIFLTCIRKKQDGQWEKTSHGEGKTVKCNIEEMAMILQLMKFTIKFWETYHDYKGQKTRINFEWEDQKHEKWLRVQIGKYTKMLNIAQVESFKIILKHILKEKLIFLSSAPLLSTLDKQNSDSTNNINGEKLKIVEEVITTQEPEQIFEFDVEKAKNEDENQKESVVHIKDIEPPEISYDQTKGNCIKDIFYEFEVKRAVMFVRNIDDMVLFIPKSMIKGGWSKDKKNPQLIALNYIPKDFGWIPRKKEF